MINNIFPLDKFKLLDTPFYYYDVELLRKTLDTIKEAIEGKPYYVHYALKANSNPRILKEISNCGFGADCVSGNEIIKAIENDFKADSIAFAGVGKTDKEIGVAIDNDIFSFNVESIPELYAIDDIAKTKNRKAKVAIRINPNVDAKTHSYITTGLNENKFGLEEAQISEVLETISSLSSIELIGLHFHIGSQITDLSAYEDLCHKINKIQTKFDKLGVNIQHINVGGGLGVDYEQPDKNPIADFKSYFDVFSKYLELRDKQTLHFELGRSIVAQCGSLISRVIYLKEGIEKKFLIVDAGMTDLIRPALYQAYHHIQNLESEDEVQTYDIVGPICESSDTFAKNYQLNRSKRKDVLAIRSTGAYGEVMSSGYNSRDLAKSFFSDSI